MIFWKCELCTFGSLACKYCSYEWEKTPQNKLSTSPVQIQFFHNKYWLSNLCTPSNLRPSLKPLLNLMKKIWVHELFHYVLCTHQWCFNADSKQFSLRIKNIRCHYYIQLKLNKTSKRDVPNLPYKQWLKIGKLNCRDNSRAVRGFVNNKLNYQTK